jgi:excisionase family DNA binding protein
MDEGRKRTPRGRPMTVSEVATYLQISRGTLWNWLSENQYGIADVGHRVGHQWRFFEKDLEAWMKRGKRKQRS